MMKRTKVDKDWLAIFIASLAVFLTLWEGYEFRQHNRKAVMPSVSDFNNRELDETPWVHLGYKSVGLGPAKVTGFHVFYDGTEEKLQQKNGFQTYFNDTMVGVLQAVSFPQGISKGDNWLEPGQLIPAGEKVALLRLKYTGENASQEFRKVTEVIDNKLDIFVCYCSVYDDQCQVAHIGVNKSLLKKVCR